MQVQFTTSDDTRRSIFEPILFQLLDGIPKYLQSSSPTVRVLGTFIGEKASMYVNPSQPMKFDDHAAQHALLDRHIIEQLHGSPIVSDTSEECDDNDEHIADGHPTVPVEEGHSAEDVNDESSDDMFPDYAAIGEEGFDSDDDTDSSSFEPHELDDDRRDLSDAKRPIYLHDCAQALAHKEDFETVKKACEVVVELAENARDDELMLSVCVDIRCATLY